MKIEFKHVPRIQNKFADALETLSSMIQHPYNNYIDPIEVEIGDQHAYCFHVEEEPDGKPWYHDIKKFLTTREYPEDATNGQKRALRRLANHSFLNREVLYRRIPKFRYLGVRLLIRENLVHSKPHAQTIGASCTKRNVGSTS
nr:uncharacterized protein LOC104109718 [Nicotiana tomentosiformis]